jgi:hypothetical protein
MRLAYVTRRAGTGLRRIRRAGGKVAAVCCEDDVRKWRGYLARSARFLTEPRAGRGQSTGASAATVTLGAVGADTSLAVLLPSRR